MAVGIDFGTEVTRAVLLRNAAADQAGNSRNAVTVANYIAYENGAFHVGELAKNLSAMSQVLTTPKFFLGCTHLQIDTLIRERHLTVQHEWTSNQSLWTISDMENTVKITTGEALVFLFRETSRRLGTGAYSTSITVPTSFNREQREAVRVAAASAGFTNATCVGDSTATLLDLLQYQTPAVGSVVCIVDAGAQFTDITLYRVVSTTRFEQLITETCTAFAGHAVDTALVDLVAAKLALQSVGIVERTRLRASCQSAKELLSQQSRAKVVYYCTSGQSTSTKVDRLELEHLVVPMRGRLCASVLMTLEAAGISTRDVSVLALVGGSMNLPGTRDALAQLFPLAQVSLRPPGSTAIGAALYGRDRWTVCNNVVTPANGVQDAAVSPNSVQPYRFDVPIEAPIDSHTSQLARASVLQSVRQRLPQNSVSQSVALHFSVATDQLVDDVVRWLRVNSSLETLLAKPIFQYDGATDCGGPYRDGMHRIFTAFANYQHADFGGSLFSGDAVKLVSPTPAVSREPQEVLRALGKMLFYALVHGNAWASWLPPHMFRSWFGVPYDRNVIYQLSPETGQLITELMQFPENTPISKSERFLAWTEMRNIYNLTPYTSISRQDLVNFIADDGLITRRLHNANLILEGFDQAYVVAAIKEQGCWLHLESGLYCVVRTPEEFLQQFSAGSMVRASPRQQQIWSWLQSYARKSSPTQLQAALRFFTGSIMIPVPKHICLNFYSGTSKAPSLPNVATCSGSVLIDDRYETEAEFHRALGHCFTEEQHFGLR